MTTYGFVGSGTTTKKNALALLDDLILGEENIYFILPASTDLWTPTMETVAEFALDANIPFDIVADDTADSHKGLTQIMQTAQKVHRVQKVPMKIVNILEKETDPSLIVAWDDEDHDALKALERALTHGIPASDITNGLEPLEFSDDEDEPTDTQQFGLPDDAGDTQPVDEIQDTDEMFDDEEFEGNTGAESPTSQEDSLSTATLSKAVAHPFSTGKTHTPAAVSMDAEEILSAAMDVLCERVATRVFAMMGTGTTSAPAEKPTKAPAKPAAKTKPTTSARAAAVKTQAKARASDGDLDLTLVREWANSQGIEVGVRGRIKQEIKDAYVKAQRTKK